MPNWKITYRTVSGFEDSIIVAAINRYMAWEIFKELSQDWEDVPVAADCAKIVED